MKKTIYTILFVIALIISSCADVDIDRENQKNSDERILMIYATMPSGNTSTRVSVNEIPGSLNLDPQWDASDKINLFFVQGELKVKGEEAMVSNISNNGKQAAFTIVVPNEIDLNGSFDVLGFCGTTGTGVNIKDGKILVDLEPDRSQKLENLSVPVWFKTEIEKIKSNNSVDFNYLGTTEIIHLQNNTTSEITIDALILQPKAGLDESWAYIPYIANENGAKLIQYFFNPITGEVEEIDNQDNPLQIEPRNIKIPTGVTKAIASWYYPKKANLPEMELMALSSDFEDGSIVSTNSKTAKDFPMRVGRAYHLYAVWNGDKLTMTDDDYEVGDLSSITLVTAKAIGETISLAIDAAEEDRDDVWIDLNNNGIKDEGEQVKIFNQLLNYEIKSQRFIVYGRISSIDCSNNQLKSLDFAYNPNLKELFCHDNELTLLDFSLNPSLETIFCHFNKLASVDVSQNIKLETFAVDYNELTSLDLSNNKNLTACDCSYNQLSSIDINNNQKLIVFYCRDNYLTSIDVSQNMELVQFWSNGNPMLKCIRVSQSQFENIPERWIKDQHTKYSLDCDGSSNDELPVITMTTSKAIGETISLAIDAAIEDREDIWIDLNNNGVKDENERVITFEYYDEYRINSHSINIYGKVTSLTCIGNQLTDLDISENEELSSLNCGDNKLTRLDVTKNSQLESLQCYSNLLDHLDITKNSLLGTLDCQSNQLTQLNATENSELSWLNCHRNQLTQLDVNSNGKLNALFLIENKMQSAALNNLYNQLPDISGIHVGEDEVGWKKLLWAFGNPGALTSNIKIATDKGWIVNVEGEGNGDEPDIDPGTRPDMPGEKW